MTDIQNANELLDRYLDGLCTDKEKERVEQWYEGIDLGRDVYTESWADASRQLFLQQHYRQRHAQRATLSVKWAAAAVVVLFLAGAGFFFSGSFKQRTRASAGAFTAATGPSGLKHIVLPDSTVVWLNANSTLRWDHDFGAIARKVTLSGEASFDVHHDAAKPFIVHTADADIKVLGTCFNVETNEPGALTQVALLRGKVTVNLNNASAESMVLQPGEVAACSASGKTLQKYKTDVQPYFSWISGGFYAANMTLHQVLEKLCTRYGYSVSWPGHRGGHKHISVSFPPQEFRHMLESLCYLNRLQYTIRDSTVIIQ
jgi:ferric-dicitrate binding protein FerR (iron transport regulator)